jgi:uncharacterized membrane protein YbhN (UPF0104 family)
VLSLTYILVAIGFPFGALAARHRGRRTLWIVTAAAILAALALALVLASSWAGNRLSATEGYATVAFKILLLATITLVLPILAAAAMASALGPRVSDSVAYPATIGVTLLMMFAGILATAFLR